MLCVMGRSFVDAPIRQVYDCPINKLAFGIWRGVLDNTFFLNGYLDTQATSMFHYIQKKVRTSIILSFYVLI